MMIEPKGTILSVDEGEDREVRVVEEEATINETPLGHPQETILLIAKIMIIGPLGRYLHHLTPHLIVFRWNHDPSHLRIHTLNQEGRLQLPRHDLILDGNTCLNLVQGIMMIIVEAGTILEDRCSHHYTLLIHCRPLAWIRGGHTIEMDMTGGQIQQSTYELIPLGQGMLETLIRHYQRDPSIQDIPLISTHDIETKVLFLPLSFSSWPTSL